MMRLRMTKRFVFNAATLNSDVKVRGATAKKPKEDISIVIIGAGLAGLSAASHLLNSGFKRTVLLEATERVGGRVDSQKFGDACCELGAKWIAVDATKNSVYEVLRQANGLQKRIRHKPLTYYANTRGQRLNKRLPDLVDMLFKQISSGIEFQEKIIAGEMQSLDNVYTYFDVETNKIVENLFEGEERKIAKDIFALLVNEFGSSLGCCLQYVNIEHITQLPKLNTWPLYVPSGLDNLLNHIAKDVAQDTLRMGKPVGQIRWSVLNPGERKMVGCLDGSVFEADHIICTVPLGVLKTFSEYMFTPQLPEKKQKAIENIGFGTPVKMYLEYSKNIRPWFKASLRPLWTEEERKESRKWTQQVVEISRLPSSNHVIEIAFGGEYYNKIERLPDVQVVDGITRLMRTFFKNSRIPYPISLLRSAWSSSACYLGGRPYISTKSSFGDVLTLAAPLGESGSLLFAGDATILAGFGTIDGARTSGIREAQRIVQYYEDNLAT